MSGRLGAIKPAATTYKTLYKPSGAIAVVNVSFCNQAGTDDNIRIAVVQSSNADPTPASNEFVMYGSLVKASGDVGFADRGMAGPYELNNANNDQLVVYSTNGNISFVCTGDEGVA